VATGLADGTWILPELGGVLEQKVFSGFSTICSTNRLEVELTGMAMRVYYRGVRVKPCNIAL
jgi:hypothetical protein